MREKVCAYVLRKSKFLKQVCLENKRSVSCVHISSMTFGSCRDCMHKEILTFVVIDFADTVALNLYMSHTVLVLWCLSRLEFAPHCGCFDPWGNVQSGDGESIYPAFADPLVRDVDAFHNESEDFDFIEVGISECSAEFTVGKQHKVS